MNDQGFSLPEVLVALLVLAIAGISLTQSGTDQMAGLRHAERKTLAMIVAENVLIESLLQDDASVIASAGTVTQGASAFEWTVKRSSSDSHGIRTVDVFVRPAGSDQVVGRLSAVIRDES